MKESSSSFGDLDSPTDTMPQDDPCITLIESHQSTRVREPLKH